VFLHAEALGKRQITTRLDKWADDVRRLVRAGANPSRNESG
jgi:hypothetical protein